MKHEAEPRIRFAKAHFSATRNATSGDIFGTNDAAILRKFRAKMFALFALPHPVFYVPLRRALDNDLHTEFHQNSEGLGSCSLFSFE
jgi:hypothetical protein